MKFSLRTTSISILLVESQKLVEPRNERVCNLLISSYMTVEKYVK